MAHSSKDLFGLAAQALGFDDVGIINNRSNRTTWFRALVFALVLDCHCKQPDNCCFRSSSVRGCRRWTSCRISDCTARRHCIQMSPICSHLGRNMTRCKRARPGNSRLSMHTHLAPSIARDNRIRQDNRAFDSCTRPAYRTFGRIRRHYRVPSRSPRDIY